MEAKANVTVTCEVCGHRNRLERNLFVEEERIAIVCHGCEERLFAEFRKPVDRQPTPEYSLGERGSWGLF